MTADGLDHGGVKGNRRERQGLVTTLQANLRIAALDVRRASAPPAHHLQSRVVYGLPVLKGLVTVLQTTPPLPQGVRRRDQVPQRAARPPDVPTRLESGEGALTDGYRFLELTSTDVCLHQAGFGNSLQVVETASVGDRDGLAAVGDRHVWPATSQAVQKPHPVVPGSMASGVGSLVHHSAN